MSFSEMSFLLAIDGMIISFARNPGGLRWSFWGLILNARFLLQIEVLSPPLRSPLRFRGSFLPAWPFLRGGPRLSRPIVVYLTSLGLRTDATLSILVPIRPLASRAVLAVPLAPSSAALRLSLAHHRLCKPRNRVQLQRWPALPRITEMLVPKI